MKSVCVCVFIHTVDGLYPLKAQMSVRVKEKGNKRKKGTNYSVVFGGLPLRRWWLCVLATNSWFTGEILVLQWGRSGCVYSK